MSSDTNDPHLHVIRLRDPGTGDPEDSQDFDWAVGRVESLVAGAVQDGRRYVINQFEKRIEQSSTTEDQERWTKLKKRMKRKLERREMRKPIDVYNHLDNISTLSSELTHDISSIFADGSDGLYRESHFYLPTPLSWFQELTRSYRGQERAYIDAILILSYIVLLSRIPEARLSPIVRLRPGEIKRELDITEECRSRGMKFLRDEELIDVLLIKGLVPWYREDDRTSGTYQFAIPRPKEIRKITYASFGRMTRMIEEPGDNYDSSIPSRLNQNLSDRSKPESMIDSLRL